MREPSHPYSHTVVMFSRLYNTENKSVSSICLYVYSNLLFYAIVLYFGFTMQKYTFYFNFFKIFVPMTDLSVFLVLLYWVGRAHI